MVWDMEDEMDVGQRELRLRKVIVRVFGLGGGDLNIHGNSQVVRNCAVF